VLNRMSAKKRLYRRIRAPATKGGVKKTPASAGFNL
jgi:hypothetical protein